MAAEPEIVAAARRIYEQAQDEALARSPLADMSEWVASGHPPTSASLRDRGLTAESPLTDEMRWVRKSFVRQWGFAIPCLEAVKALARVGPLVEVGAGTGCWTALLYAAGHDVIATDLADSGAQAHTFVVGCHAPIEALSAQAAVAQYPHRSVLCSWPTEGASWAADVAAELGPGKFFVLIGDGRGGTTGDARLFDTLDAKFETVSTVQIPQFPGVRDVLTIYRRSA